MTFKLEVGKTYRTTEARPREAKVIYEYVNASGTKIFAFSIGYPASQKRNVAEGAEYLLTAYEDGHWFGGDWRLEPIPVEKVFYRNMWSGSRNSKKFATLAEAREFKSNSFYEGTVRLTYLDDRLVNVELLQDGEDA